MGFMLGHGERMSLKKKFISYMLLLAMLLLCLLLIGLFLLGRFESTGKKTYETLDIQMAFFEKDVCTYFETLAAESIRLSENMSVFLEEYLEESDLSFEELNEDRGRIEEIQNDMMEPMRQQLKQQNCSGIFTMWNVSADGSEEGAENSRTGVYLQNSSYDNADESIVLYRGLSSVGKAHGVLPHQKWKLEFQTDMIPDYGKIAENAAKPIEEAYMLTELFTLPGTSDDVLLMTIPIVGSDGSFYGICGFEVSENHFMSYHEQPTNTPHLLCVLSPEKEGKVAPSEGLICSGENDYIHLPESELAVKAEEGNLVKFSGEPVSYVGNVKQVVLSPNNGPYLLSVMIPETDYRNEAVKNNLQMGVMLVLLLLLAVNSCIYFSRRYLSPIIDTLNALTEEKQAVENEYRQTKLELERLAYSRKNEVDPDDYQNFLNGMKTLTPMEKTILNYYTEGKGVKEIMELAGIKESTVRYHNRNLYSKLGVSSLKQLLRYSAILNCEPES